MVNDRGISSLAKAQTDSQLRKDSDTQKRGARQKGSRRTETSGLSSSSLSSTTSSISGRSSLSSNVSKNISGDTSINKDAEAKRRLNNNQRLNNAIKIAEKIPVAQKYAKVAKLAQKVSDAKAKKGGMFGKLFGNNNKPNLSEIEDANAADNKGEEFNPEDSGGKYTVKLDKRTKVIFASVVLGIVCSSLLLCVIIVSAVTGGAKEAYLASHENPSEEDIAKAYDKDEESGDWSSSSSSSSGDSRIKPGSTSNIIMVGDSGIVGVCISAYNSSSYNCETPGYKKDNVTFISKGSMALTWFKNTAMPEVVKQLNANPKSSVLLNMGGNGLDNEDGYAKYYNQLAKDYPDANILAVAVTPINDEHVQYYREINKDANVVRFNNALKNLISSDVIFCDLYSKVKGKVTDAGDGIHFDNKSNILINEAMLSCLKVGASSTDNSSFNTLLSKGGISVDKLNQKNIKQLVVVDSSGTSASISYYENNNGTWTSDSGLTTSGYVGRSGTTSSPSEGKSATPKGLYAIGDAFYQNTQPNTKLNSFKITSNTYWIDDPNSKYYNQKVEGTANKDWSSAEHMSTINSYKYGFVIRYNMDPVVKGAGSAIFFHINHGSPTGGCVSAPEDKVLDYLAKLDKSKNPYILII